MSNKKSTKAEEPFTSLQIRNRVITYDQLMLMLDTVYLDEPIRYFQLSNSEITDIPPSAPPAITYGAEGFNLLFGRKIYLGDIQHCYFHTPLGVKAI